MPELMSNKKDHWSNVVKKRKAQAKFEYLLTQTRIEIYFNEQVRIINKPVDKIAKELNLKIKSFIQTYEYNYGLMVRFSSDQLNQRDKNVYAVFDDKSCARAFKEKIKNYKDNLDAVTKSSNNLDDENKPLADHWTMLELDQVSEWQVTDLMSKSIPEMHCGQWVLVTPYSWDTLPQCFSYNLQNNSGLHEFTSKYLVSVAGDRNRLAVFTTNTDANKFRIAWSECFNPEENTDPNQQIGGIEENCYSADEEHLEVENISDTSGTNNLLFPEYQGMIGGKNNELSFPFILGRCPEMILIGEYIRKVSMFRSTVLFTGETGTGKELMARAIHLISQRRVGSFIAINCAGIPEDLLESELFGYMKGAFTNATADKPGKFELSHNGTIFLDEIGDLSLEAQAKLLRVLEDGIVTRLGDTKERHIDFRIVAATNYKLDQMVIEKRFRADLFHRISVFPIELPPLRERGLDDIKDLISFFVESKSKANNITPPRLHDRAIERLCEWSWPGNIRELEHTIERALILSLGEPFLGLEHVVLNLNQEKKDNLFEDTYKDAFSTETLRKATDKFEREYIKQALEKNHYNQTKTAIELGVHRNTILNKIEQYGLNDF